MIRHVLCLALILSVTTPCFSAPAAGSSSGSAAPAAQTSSNFTQSDAAYAEVAAISYQQMRLAAQIMANNLKQYQLVMKFDPDLPTQQMALQDAEFQFNNAAKYFCNQMAADRAAATPKPGPRPMAGFLTGEVGSILGGLADIAQLFTPHVTSASTEIGPDDQALEADLVAQGVALMSSAAYLPPPSHPDMTAVNSTCDYYGVLPKTPPTDFPTLWAMAAHADQLAEAEAKPSKKLQELISQYQKLAKSYSAGDAKSGSPYYQVLKAAALQSLLASQKAVLLSYGVDAMGGTTSVEGKTVFSSKTTFSGGVVVRYVIYKQSGDSLSPVAGGTISRTASNVTLEDIKTMLNN